MHLPVCFFLVLLLTLHPVPLSNAQLSPSFYATSCPNAVSTVTNTIVSLSKKDNVIPPSTLRLILHDCFVEGCDASILLSSTSGSKAERDAPDNANLPQNAFNAIVAAKKAVEAICPGVVSCADILALAARDVVVFLGGPSWDVPLGRLDGRVSTASSVTGRLPGANFNVKQLSDNFGSVGLSLQDMVILSGAHTVGFSHCDQFKNRLYDFNNSVKVDPSMDSGFVKQLQQKCPAGGQDNLQEFDISTPFVFDNNYYKDLQSGKGLLFSDQVLFQDSSTQATVASLATSQDQFFKSFTASMIKMTSIGVKQGNQGEIRRECTVVNPDNGNNPGTNPNARPPPNVAPVVPAPELPPPASPPPQAFPPPTPSVRPPAPALVPPTPVKFEPPPTPATVNPPPTPVAFKPPPTPAVFKPPPTPITLDPPPAPVSFTPPPSPGFTIPGIPGFTPPIHIPIPGFGGGSPPPGGGASPSSRSRRSSRTSP